MLGAVGASLSAQALTVRALLVWTLLVLEDAMEKDKVGQKRFEPMKAKASRKRSLRREIGAKRGKAESLAHEEAHEGDIARVVARAVSRELAARHTEVRAEAAKRILEYCEQRLIEVWKERSNRIFSTKGNLERSPKAGSTKDRSFENAPSGYIPVTPWERLSILKIVRAEAREEALLEACVKALVQGQAVARSRTGTPLERRRAQARARAKAGYLAEAWAEANIENRSRARASAKREHGTVTERIRAGAEAEIVERDKEEARAQGRSKGRSDATARAVLRVLEARGIEVSTVDKKRILACHRLKTLEAWHTKSVSAARVSELFE